MNEKIIRSDNEKLTYVFDLDGVIYRGKIPQPFAVESVNALLDKGHNVYYFTNNACHTRQFYKDKIHQMGIETELDHIMTSAYASALYMTETYGDMKGKSVYVVGMEGIFDEMERMGMICYGKDGEQKNTDFVLCGLDREMTYNKIWGAMTSIRNGAVFIATNRDKTFPLEHGMFAPAGGACVAAIEECTGYHPYVCGKPNTYVLDKIMRITGSDKEHTIMIGDRLDTDIEVANNASVTSCLVLGGCSTREEAEKAEGKLRPDYIIEDLRPLV
ncbi:MAG: HAD-IIA family hydrolase [Armatimonadetes bacterium]|nr:HAD-IIA family hydrolase [Candidatus Hippobium faecium]